MTPLPHPPHRPRRARLPWRGLVVAGACLGLLPTGALAQYQSVQNALAGTPQGLTQIAPMAAPTAPPQFAAGPGPAASMATAPAFPPSAPMGPAAQLPPLPPDPATAATPLVFGSQIFSGRFALESGGGFNPDYPVAVGDSLSIRMWGAFSFDSLQAVDAQGNVFIPNVGPVHVANVRNGDLNQQVAAQVQRTFRANVGVYATLAAAQPVRVLVTGFVRAPGLYAGLSSDSILHYLDKAGGIDPERGSYLEVDVMRGGRLRAKVNLVDFLLKGDMPTTLLQDGDTLLARPRKHSATVTGAVFNPYVFEFEGDRIPAGELLAIARPRPEATHLSIVRMSDTDLRSEYHPLDRSAEVVFQDGDVVTLTSDKAPGTILVHVTGAHLGERTLVLPYGARIQDVLARVRPAPQSRLANLQLFRPAVAARQRELLNISLRGIENYALTSRSATSEEAALRSKEAELLLQFIDRASRVDFKGQVVLAGKASMGATLLEDGDTLNIPEESNLVAVSGQVTFPSALVAQPGATVADYIEQAGGFQENAQESRIVVLHQDGSVAASDANPVAGDEILVLPRPDIKRVEIARGISQILFQVAVAAKVVLGL
jgi:protein involved in polysaccharide export with SLBB domain